jgi:hypothetical protein
VICLRQILKWQQAQMGDKVAMRDSVPRPERPGRRLRIAYKQTCRTWDASQSHSGSSTGRIRTAVPRKPSPLLRGEVDLVRSHWHFFSRTVFVFAVCLGAHRVCILTPGQNELCLCPYWGYLVRAVGTESGIGT